MFEEYETEAEYFARQGRTREGYETPEAWDARYRKEEEELAERLFQELYT